MILPDMEYKTIKEYFIYDPITGIFKDKQSHYTPFLTEKGYLMYSINSHNYLLHRLIWFYVYGAWPKMFLDHINGIRVDNRICNLREANYRINAQNRIEHRRGKPVGCEYRKDVNKWKVTTKVNGVKYNLGYYFTLEEAQNIYAIAQLKINNGEDILPMVKHYHKSYGTLKGAYYRPITRKWESAICKNAKRIYIGTFSTELEAHNAYLLYIKDHSEECV
jgi:hypothetical protein